MKADENAGEDARFASRIRHLLIRAQAHEGKPEFRLAKKTVLLLNGGFCNTYISKQSIILQCITKQRTEMISAVFIAWQFIFKIQ
jgi:hypothetical protein